MLRHVISILTAKFERRFEKYLSYKKMAYDARLLRNLRKCSARLFRPENVDRLIRISSIYYLCILCRMCYDYILLRILKTTKYCTLATEQNVGNSHQFLAFRHMCLSNYLCIVIYIYDITILLTYTKLVLKRFPSFLVHLSWNSPQTIPYFFDVVLLENVME